MKRYINIVVVFLLILVAPHSYAASIALSSNNEGGNSIFTGELLATSCAQTAVVLFHGRGSTPTGPVVEEIRNSLFRAGYTTLSIDNPIPASGLTTFTDYINDADAVFNETYARMRTAINYLQSLGVEQVVVVGFSLGARLATAHVARGQINELPILGLIGVGMYGNSIDPLNVSSTLDEVSVPVLDIYGNADTSAVSTAADRLNAYNTGTGVSYTQTSLFCLSSPNNCHRLEGLKGNDSEPLEITISAWLQANAPALLVSGCTVPVPVIPEPLSLDSAGGGSFTLYLSPMLLLLLYVLRRYNIVNRRYIN